MKKLVFSGALLSMLFVASSFTNISETKFSSSVQKASPDAEFRQDTSGPKYDPIYTVDSNDIHFNNKRGYYYYLVKNNHTQNYDSIVSNTKDQLKKDVKEITKKDNTYGKIMASFIFISLGALIVYLMFKKR